MLSLLILDLGKGEFMGMDKRLISFSAEQSLLQSEFPGFD